MELSLKVILSMKSRQIDVCFFFWEVLHINLFEEIKGQATAKMAAEHYGIKVRPNGMACCPFHSDRHPSMKIDNTYYYCFGCGAHGDAIDFVAKLNGISQYDAARKINEDFSLGIEITKKKSKPGKKKKEKTEHERAMYVKKKIEEWIRETIDDLNAYMSWIEFWKEFYKPEPMDEDWHPLFTEVLGNEKKIKDYLDILMSGSEEETLELFVSRRKELKQYGDRIKEYQRRVFAELRGDCQGGNDDC